MPKKNFVAGTVLRAADVNQYLTTSKNAIINAAFDVWQRGTSITPGIGVSVYNADRFFTYRDGSSSVVTVSQQAFTPGTAPIAGVTDREGSTFLRFAQTTAGSGGTVNMFCQAIEDVRNFANQTVTVSFWGKADSTRTITPSFIRSYGTGGSTGETVVTGSAITLTTSWARYSSTLVIPALTGKTIGAGSYLQLTMLLAVNTAQTIDLWGFQVEEGSTATEFSRNAPNIQAELAACQRYYYRAVAGSTYGVLASGKVYSAYSANTFLPLPVTMRVAPTSLEWSGTTGNYQLESGSTAISITSLGLSAFTNNNRAASIDVGSGPSMTTGAYLVLMASNSATAYIGVSAEF